MRVFRRQRGTTLLEIMVVIAILGVLGSVAVVGINSVVGRARVARDADNVENLLRRARNLARSQRRCVRVDATATRIVATPLDHGFGPPPSCVGGVELVGQRIEITLPRGVRLAPTTFFFDRLGGAVNGPQDVLVTVSAADTPPRTFVVSALAGAGTIVRRG